MVVARRRGHGGGRGGASRSGSSGSRAAHAISRDVGSRPPNGSNSKNLNPNISMPRSSAAFVTRGGSSGRGRGGSVTARAQGSRPAFSESAHVLEKDLSSIIPNSNLVLDTPLEPGLEISLPLDRNIASTSKDAVTHVTCSSSKETEVQDTLPILVVLL